ncbi:MAG: carbohydrate ABC transporter substrate-binding protein [Bacteroidetes bacterium]|nr:carbohydrate ABC transporter substrate-binding protein [Bacteroidota bacterium]
MTKKSKRISVVLSVLMILAVMSPLWSAAQEEKADVQETVELRMSWWGGEARHEATLDALDRFMEENPNIEVKAEYGGWSGYYDKMIAQLVGGAAPDVIQITFSWLDDLAAQGNLFVDLFEKDQIDISNFNMDYLKNYAIRNDRLMTLPAGKNGAVLLYNKDVTDGAGLDLNRNLTWDDLLEVGKEFHKSFPDSYMLSPVDEDYAGIVGVFVRQMINGPLIQQDKSLGFTEKQMAEAFAWVQESIDSGAFQPLSETTLYKSDIASSPKWLNSEMMMMERPAAMIEQVMAAVDFNIGVTKYPHHEGTTYYGLQASPGLLFSINSKSEHIDESAELINYLLSEKNGVEALGTVRGTPVNTEALGWLVEAGKVSEQLSDAMKLIEKSDSGPYVTYEQNAEIKTIFNDISAKVVYGVVTPVEAAAELIERFQEKLAELE